MRHAADADVYPWMCMRESNFLLSLIIQECPGDHMDLYLSPLIEEVKELWELGVHTFDKLTGQTFKMRARLLRTISDFVGYAFLSKYSTKGAIACSWCHIDTSSMWLKHG